MAKDNRGGKRAGYTTVEGEKVYNSAPKGFKMLSNGGTTGIETWTNGKSLFSGERKNIKVKGDDFSEYYNKNGQPTAKTKVRKEQERKLLAQSKASAGINKALKQYRNNEITAEEFSKQMRKYNKMAYDNV